MVDVDERSATTSLDNLLSHVPTDPPKHRRRSWGRRRIVAALSCAALLALVVGAAAFWLTGGRWFVVQTPSMGAAAPVGTLVLTRETDVGDLRVGNIITFHPPTERNETYTHRIVAITAKGIVTRGDINGARDPWALHAADIVGRSTVIPGLGWLIRAFPLFIVGGLVVWGATRRWLAQPLRGPARMIGAAVLWLVASLTIRPWMGVVQLAATTTDGRTDVSAVSTGLLPIQLSVDHGQGTATPVDLTYGGTGVVHLTHPPAGGRYALHASVHLGWLGCLLVIAFCALPLLWTIIVGYRVEAPHRHAATASATS